MILDAHVHFWDPAAQAYPWLGDLPALDRAFRSSDHAAAAPQVEQVIVVEGNCAPGQHLAEAAWLDSLAGADSRIAALVPFAPVDDPAALHTALDTYADMPRVRGVRRNIQGEQPGFCMQRDFVNGVREIGCHGFTFDLCITHDQLREAIALVRACPDTAFVLDHCAKPAIREHAPERWRSDLALLSSAPNVHCKISGLLTEADATCSDDEILSYAAHAAECFGVDRVLFGSDWPVLTLAVGYDRWWALMRRFTRDWSDADRAGFFGGNAAAVYGVASPETARAQ